MKKLKIQKELLKYVSEDDMAFIDAYNLLKIPKAPHKDKFIFVEQKTLLAGSSPITKDVLKEWLGLIESGHSIGQFSSGYSHGIRSSKETNNIADYEKAKKKYDDELVEYMSSYDSLHPIVTSIMNQANEKHESKINGYDKLPDDIECLKEIIRKSKIKI